MAYESTLALLGTLTASADCSAKQYRFAKSSGAGTFTFAAARTDALTFIIQNAPASGAVGSLAFGGVSKIEAGAAVTATDRLTSDSIGRGITASGDDSVGAIALDTAAGAGEFIPCLVLPLSIQATGAFVQGVAEGYKIARGQGTTVAASDTVVTGLATVVSVVANLESAPVLTCDRVNGNVGTQAGAPAAGSILITSWMPTSSSVTTPIAATTFSKLYNWIAVGT